VLVLLMRRIYDVCHRDALRWHDIYIPNFRNTGTGMSEILMLYLRNMRDHNVGNTDGIYNVCC
jgi:hypothetical protein